MSEAFARMHLRDYVRQDDIDHAISVTIQSFISAQKHSVKKQLSKVFEKYLNLDKDSFELLNHILSELQMEHMRYQYYRGLSMPETIEIDVEEFAVKASDVGVHDLTEYFQSSLFKQSFSLDLQRNKICVK